MTQFTSERLLLERLVHSVSDASKAQIIAQIPSLLEADVVENLPPYFHAIDSEPKAVRWLDRMLSESELFLVRQKHGDDLMGFLFVSPDPAGEVHIGYLLGKAHWRKGYAFELLQRFITYAQTRDEWKVLIGGVEVSNTASSSLLIKLGFAPQQSSKGVVFYRYSLD